MQVRATGKLSEDYFSLTVEPLSILLAAELSLKLETPISLSFSGRFSGDLAGRARAFQSMVGAGMDTSKAGRTCRADGTPED